MERTLITEEFYHERHERRKEEREMRKEIIKEEILTEARRRRGHGGKIKIKIKIFWRGFVMGILSAVFFFGLFSSLIFFSNKNKRRIEYAEKQLEIEALREDYINRDVDEFLEIPDVRRAADGAADEFIRKRDEVLHRFRNRIAD